MCWSQEWKPCPANRHLLGYHSTKRYWAQCLKSITTFTCIAWCKKEISAFRDATVWEGSQFSGYFYCDLLSLASLTSLLILIHRSEGPAQVFLLMLTWLVAAFGRKPEKIGRRSLWATTKIHEKWGTDHTMHTFITFTNLNNYICLLYTLFMTTLMNLNNQNYNMKQSINLSNHNNTSHENSETIANGSLSSSVFHGITTDVSSKVSWWPITLITNTTGYLVN